MEFNGLKYSINGKGTSIDFEEELPSSLIKFYTNTERSQEMIMTHYLYLTHVSQYNDAFEASEYMLDFRNFDKETYTDWYGRKLRGLKVIPYEEVSAYDFALLRQLYKLAMTVVGSVSFTTEDNDLNTLLWSHYASDTGFAVKFKIPALLKHIDKEQQFSSLLFPVNYVKDLLPFDPTNSDCGKDRGALLYLISTKKQEWKYENEWRLSCFPKELNIFTSPETMLTPEMTAIERKLYYPAECINAIILGEKFFNLRNVDCEEWRQQMTPFRFKLTRDKEFVSFLYENFNDKLFMCGQQTERSGVVRTKQQISLTKEAEDTFVIAPLTSSE